VSTISLFGFKTCFCVVCHTFLSQHSSFYHFLLILSESTVHLCCFSVCKKFDLIMGWLIAVVTNHINQQEIHWYLITVGMVLPRSKMSRWYGGVMQTEMLY